MSDWIRGSLLIVMFSMVGCSGGDGADDLMRRARRSTSEPETVETADPTAENPSELAESLPPGPSTSDTASVPENAVLDPSMPATGGEPDTDSNESPTPVASDLGISPDRLATDPGVDSFEDYRRRMEEIGRAFAAEMAETKYVPAPSMMDSDGNPTLSWRVRLLPKLGFDGLYRKFKLNEPWNSPHNLALLPLMPKVFRSGASEVGRTGFLLPQARYTLFRTGGGGLAGLADITDGVGSTVMMVMALPSRAVPWTAPEDYLVDEGNDVKDLAMSDRETYLVLWADGRAAEIRSGAVSGEYRKMMTYCGRESFSPRDIEFGVTSVSDVDATPGAGEEMPSSGLSEEGMSVASHSSDLPSRLSGASFERLMTGDFEHAAELALLSELLRDESSPDFRGMYLPATGGMVPFVRIGLGATVPLGPRTSDANPIRSERGNAAGLRRAPQELETLTGDLGEAVVADLLKEMELGHLGVRQTPSGAGNAGASSPSMDQRFLSLGIEYLGNDRLPVLLDGARYRGLDMLIHFDVELTVTRQNITSNTTIVRVHDVRSGKKLFESPPINNIREMRSESNVGDESVLAKARVKFQEFLTESVRLARDHEPTPDEVRARVTKLTEKAERSDWAAALEVREYFQRGLISRVEFENAFYLLLNVDGQSFAAADQETRFESLLAGQDASLVLAAREAKSWEPKPEPVSGDLDN